MASKTYKTEAIVLKKTKLNETDLILTLLNMDGKQIRAVAKGARKPSSVFSSRLELASQVNLLLVEGKTLDIVKEAKLIEPFVNIRGNVEKFSAVSPALELLYKSSLPELKNENIYLPTVKFLHVINDSDNPESWAALCAAHLIKSFAYLGIRPQLQSCIKCNGDMKNVLVDVDLPLAFSYLDGGLLCRNCAQNIQTEKISARCAKLIHQLMHDRFDEIDKYEFDNDAVIQVFEFCKLWINCHLGNNMKSLKFYLKGYNENINRRG